MSKKHPPQRRMSKAPRAARRPRIPHDSAYKRLFSEPLMVRSLLQDLIGGELVAGMNLDTLRRENASYVTRDDRHLYSDIVWTVQRKETDAPPCYIAILLEFQSTPNKLMALRMLAYVAVLLKELTKDKTVQASGYVPFVLPIVLYNGSAPWTAALDVSELMAPVPECLRPFNPQMRYLLLEERKVPPETLQDTSIAAQLVRLEQVQTGEELVAVLSTVLALLPDESDVRQEALVRAFGHFVSRSVYQRLGIPAPKHFDLRKERPMLAETVDRWREEAIAKGRAEGRAEGIADGLREAARRMLAAGGITPEAIARMLGLDEGEVRGLAAAQ